MRLQTLRAQAAQVLSEMMALSEAAAERMFSAEESEKFKALEDKHTALLAEIEREERLEAARRASPQNIGGADPDQAAATAAARAAGVQVGQDRADADPTCGFRTLGEFAMSVRQVETPGLRVVDPRLARMMKGPQAAPTNYHKESGSVEGYEVPAQFRDSIYELVFAEDDILSAVSPEPTSSNAVEMLSDETTPWGASGVQANWRAEGSQMTPSRGDTKRELVRLHELYAFVLATDELLQDAPRLNDRLTRKAAAAIRYKASEALMHGTGAGQPKGWMKHGALVTVSKETSQAAATVVAANVLKMYSRLIADGGGIFWAAHRSTLPQIAVMQIGNQPIWTPPSAGLKDAPGGMLLGFPLRWTEHADTVGTKGDLQLVNPNGYYATVKGGPGGGMQFASSIHLYFDYGIQAFRWTFRLGGQPYLSAAVSPAKGSETRSHFVCLETRS